MRTENGFQATLELVEVKTGQGRLVLQGNVRVDLPIPPQDDRLLEIPSARA